MRGDAGRFSQRWSRSCASMNMPTFFEIELAATEALSQ